MIDVKSARTRAQAMRDVVADALDYVASEVEPYTNFDDGMSRQDLDGMVEEMGNVRQELAARMEDVVGMRAEYQDYVDAIDDVDALKDDIELAIGEIDRLVATKDGVVLSDFDPDDGEKSTTDPSWSEAADRIADIAHAIGVTHAHPIALDMKSLVANVDAVAPAMRRWRAVVSRNITQRAVVEFDAPEGVDRWHLTEAIAAQVPDDAWVGGEPSMGYVDQMEPVGITAIGQVGLAVAA